VNTSDSWAPTVIGGRVAAYANAWSFAYGFKGGVDQVGIFSTGLGDAQITDISKNGITDYTEYVEAYYTFDECTNGTVSTRTPSRVAHADTHSLSCKTYGASEMTVEDDCPKKHAPGSENGCPPDS